MAAISATERMINAMLKAACTVVSLQSQSSDYRRQIISQARRGNKHLSKAVGAACYSPKPRTPNSTHACLGERWIRLHRHVSPSPGRDLWPLRSEEHTSELQSRENLVCRLLLEK